MCHPCRVCITHRRYVSSTEVCVTQRGYVSPTEGTYHPQRVCIIHRRYVSSTEVHVTQRGVHISHTGCISSTEGMHHPQRVHITHREYLSPMEVCFTHNGYASPTEVPITRTGYLSPTWGMYYPQRACVTNRGSGGSRIYWKGMPTPKLGMKSYYSANFFLPKLHKSEKNWNEGGYPGNPLGSAIERVYITHKRYAEGDPGFPRWVSTPEGKVLVDY